MTDPADIRFFKALKEVCEAAGSIDPTLRDAIDRAIETGDPLDMRTARAELDQLDDKAKTDIFRQVHLRMATDLSAIWDLLPGAPAGKDRAN